MTKQVIYDEHSKHIEKTADGDKEIKNVLRYDTIGHTWKYRINFKWQSVGSFIWVGISHGRLYEFAW